MFRNSDWDCPDCGNRVFGSKKECGKCGKWRPKSNSAVSNSNSNSNPSSQIQRKPGDWDCPGCSEINFASRDKCRKCGSSKVSASSSNSSNSSNSAAPISASSKGRPGDWVCAPCNEINFGSRKVCHKCGADRNGEGLCAVCLDKTADICLRKCGHIVMCQSCANMCHECPVCRVAYLPTDCIKSFKLV